MTDEVLGQQNGRPQKRRARADAFTLKKRQRFLDALALTCNVRRSAAYARVNLTTPYYHRLRDPIFAEQWYAALAVGYDRLEVMVVEHGGAGERLDVADAERAETDADAPPPFDFDKALKILGHYLKKREGQAVKTGGRFHNAGREETNAALVKALAAAKRRVARSGGGGE